MIEENTSQTAEQAVNLNALIDTARTRYAEFRAVGMALKQPITYREFHDRILVLAARLRKDGVKFGDRVAILAENSHNWATVYFAVVRLGAICVPILPDLPEADVRHILTEMRCGVIFTSRQQIGKLHDLPPETAVSVTLDDHQESSASMRVIPFTDYLAGAEAEFSGARRNDSLQFPEVESDHPASILYTSGTSGFSKAVILSHGNFCANAAAVDGIIALEPGIVFLSILPLSHVYEFTVGLLMPVLKGGCVMYAGKSPTPKILSTLCSHERPHAMLVVPLVMEKIYKKRVVPVVEQSRILSFLCRFQAGRRLVFRRVGAKLSTFFGGRLKILGIGGAALNPEVEEFLRDAGLPFLVGYGMTEASPLISVGPAGDSTIRLGSAGKPVPGVEVCIDAPDPRTGIGEILVRGPNVMQGYRNNPEATAEAVDAEGRLHTGDLGRFDESGNLHIKGRSKSVIVLANGENVYPEAVEHKLNCYPLTTDSLVVERKGALEALVHPDYTFVEEQMPGKSEDERRMYITAELERIRKEVNAQTGSVSRLTKIVEQQEPFVKTATHKIKRYLYAEGGP